MAKLQGHKIRERREELGITQEDLAKSVKMSVSSINRFERNQADWIGIAATPQASLLIRSHEQQNGKDIQNVMIDYPVPMKDLAPITLRAVNWPKGFYVKGVRPLKEGEDARAKCLALLARSGVPKGTEAKYFNTVTFFDFCVERWKSRGRK